MGLEFSTPINDRSVSGTWEEAKEEGCTPICSLCIVIRWFNPVQMWHLQMSGRGHLLAEVLFGVRYWWWFFALLCLTLFFLLYQLSVSHCRIQILGASLRRCVALEELRLAHNQLSVWLQILNISFNVDVAISKLSEMLVLDKSLIVYSSWSWCSGATKGIRKEWPPSHSRPW